jgi:hypothetical protein
LIVAVLSCFDRVIFKGYLSITDGAALEGFVDQVLKIPRCDLIPIRAYSPKKFTGREGAAEGGSMG